ncbi:MAG: 2-polyprenylphenol 6-hydroxylase [Magnetococcales bacterium]|nr:2-polyprenylphenol 6-hydroxylase [Magnetococcales bacterium]
MLDTYRSFFRLIDIIWIIISHRVEPITERFFPLRLICWIVGFLPSVYRRRKGKIWEVRAREALERLGPTFIKFGQALSTRMESLPEGVGREMKKLQDAVPPFPFEEVKRIVEKDLEGPLEQFYQEFQEVPVASASIAQVHRAITLEGREVAVKVQRPKVQMIVERDIRLLFSLATFIETYIPDFARFRARKVVEEFASTIRTEMNFQVEASRAQSFRKNFQNDPELHVPAVFWTRTTQRVLTLEWIDGVPIDELSRMTDSDLDVERISRNIITVFFKQVFRDGYFHADQHPGNIMVRGDGTVSILDFGIVGRVTMQTRLWLAEILRGFLMRDYRKVAQIHIDAGWVPIKTNLDEFEDACRQIGEPIFGQPLKEISIAKLLSQLFKVTERFNMEVQPQLLLLQKTLFTLEGVGREINPNLNMWLLSEPLIRDWMGKHLGVMGQLKKIGGGVEDLARAAEILPDFIHMGMDRMVQDKFHVRLHPTSLDGVEERMNAGFRRQSATISGSALFLGGTILAASGISPWLYGPVLLYGFSSILQGKRSRRKERNN